MSHTPLQASWGSSNRCLLQWAYMQLIGTINASYYCERHKPSGPILILTTGAYVVAEFAEPSGLIKWHRVVPAPQKNVIESWFNVRFPQRVVAAEQRAKKSLAEQTVAAL